MIREYTLELTYSQTIGCSTLRFVCNQCNFKRMIKKKNPPGSGFYWLPVEQAKIVTEYLYLSISPNENQQVTSLKKLFCGVFHV